MNPMQTAPKDKQVLLDVGLPWLVVGIWNEHSEQWIYADLRIDMLNGEWIDAYFENEWEKSPKGWIPLPEKEK